MDTSSFVAFLRMEADMSEEKAKRLRTQADALAQQHGITVEMESSYGKYGSFEFWGILESTGCFVIYYSME